MSVFCKTSFAIELNAFADFKLKVPETPSRKIVNSVDLVLAPTVGVAVGAIVGEEDIVGAAVGACDGLELGAIFFNEKRIKKV